MIVAGETRAARMSVLRNKLTDRIRAKAFGRPNREENPAARMRTCSLGRGIPFIGIMLT
jgi:hypothetical protein